MDHPVRMRNIEGAEILDTINCAAIADRFFHRSRAWFSQRLNNNLVNGKAVSFSADELLTLRTALKTLASEITHYASNIPNPPSEMSVKVYVIENPIAIEHLINLDIESFNDYLAEEKYLDFPEPECFDTEAEAIAFCRAFARGTDERGIPSAYPLRSSEPEDIPFIRAIENY